MKQCCVCLVDKCFYDFNKASRSADGLDSRCKQCRRESTVLWKSKNKEKISEYDKHWRSSRKERKLELNRGYRARKLNSRTEPYTEVDVISVYGTSCHICGYAIDMQAPRKVGLPGWQNGLHLDHVIALSRGGADSVENVKPAHGLCNIIKNANPTA